MRNNLHLLSTACWRLNAVYRKGRTLYDLLCSIIILVYMYTLNPASSWVRPWSHYGRNDSDGDGTLTFYRSHYMFRNTNVNVAFTWRDNGCHGDVSRRCLFRSAQAKKWVMATKGKKPRARWDSDTERKLIDANGRLSSSHVGMAHQRALCGPYWPLRHVD